MCLKVLILFCFIINSAICAKELLNIVGIFEEASEEENLREAIGKFNLEPSFAFKYYLIPIKLYPDDSFAAFNNTCQVLRQGIVGIFGPTSTSNVNMVGGICQSKHIPNILTHWVESEKTEMQINFFPRPDILITAYLDIIADLEWTDVTVLYVNSEILSNVAYFAEEANKAGVDVNIVQLEQEDDEEIRLLLVNLRESGRSNFVIYSQVADLEFVLQNLQQNGMLTEGFHYLLTDVEAGTLPLKLFSYGGARFIVIHLSNISKDLSTKILTPKSEADLLFDALYLFSTMLKTMSITKSVFLDCNDGKTWKDGQRIVTSLKSVKNFYGLTGPMDFDTSGNRKAFDLGVFEVQDGISQYTAKWNTLHRFTKLSPVGQDTEVKKLKVITSLTTPYAMLKESENPLQGNDRYEGFVIDLIEELSYECDFHYEFSIRGDMFIGSSSPEKGWTGMIGDILSEKVDLAVGDITITTEREQVVDFSIPYILTGVTILYRKGPTSLPPTMLETFLSGVWIYILAACTVTSIVLLILGRLSAEEWVNPYPTNLKHGYATNELTFMNCFMFTIGSLMRQTHHTKLRSIATRIVAAIWWFFALITVSFFVAHLVVTLLHREDDNEKLDFSNLDELVRIAPEKGIQYGAKYGGATADFFKTQAKLYPDSPFATAYEYMQEHVHEVMMPSNVDGVSMARNQRYAYFMESASLEYTIERECELRQIGGLLNSKGYGIAMRKNEPLRNCLNTGILKLQYTGKIAQLKQKWWHEKRSNRCYDTEEYTEIGPLYLVDFWDIFFITLLGVLMALLLAIVEAALHIVSKATKAKIPLSKAFKDEAKFFFSFSKMVKQPINKQYSNMHTGGSSTGPYSEEKELNVVK